MRVTSQMLTTNMMNNVNRNKINMNKKGDRYATGQAIQKPSDDPVVAVRTLKYRSQLTKIEQYLDTNIPEALSWMEITEEALMGVSELVRNINTYCNQGVNSYYELTDRNSIVSTLEEYKAQIFDLGNTDYAGRYVFTGYRTDTPLMFEEATNPAEGKSPSWTTYNITENLHYTDVTAKSYIAGGAEYDAGKTTTADEYAAMAPSLGSANRLQLSYGNLDAVNSLKLTDKNGNNLIITTTGTVDKEGPDGQKVQAPVVKAEDGTVIDDGTAGFKLVSKSMADYNNIKPDAYATVEAYNTARDAANPYNAGPNEVVYIEETGELILGSNVMASAAVYTDISVNFDKTEFAKGDLRPEHYFECSTDYYLAGDPNSKEHINYAEPGVQEIQYELNTNQKLTVNTLAKDSLSTSLVTKIDEIIQSVNSVFDIKDQITEAKKTLQNASTEEEKAAINSYIAQLETEEVLRTQILTESFSSALTTTQKAQEKTDEAVADIGSRYLRGQLIESRLEEQKTTVTELLSDIFYVDLEDAIVEYNAAQVYYNASLMCASKVVQQTLLDYLR